MAADSQEFECHCTGLYTNCQMSVPEKNIMTAIQCQVGITDVGECLHNLQGKSGNAGIITIQCPYKASSKISQAVQVQN